MKFIPYFLVGLIGFSACTEVPEEITWKSIEKDLQQRLILTEDSAVIELPAGNFMFTGGLIMDGKNNVTITGAGAEKTILSFANQAEGAEGLKVANGNNITLSNFTIEDSKGDNIKVTDVNGLTISGVRSRWNGEPKEENGAYAFYPVLSKNIIIEYCEAIGASDAGIYVGQSDSVIIRNNRASLNVAGIESENSRWVEIYNNEAHENTGGILVFDLPGLTMTGHTTRVYGNRVYENNYRNFAPAGNIVATVPPGTGIMLLATRNIEIWKNEIIDNRTAGLAIASYELVKGLATENESQLNNNIETAGTDEAYDPYPNQVYIHHNIFENGYAFPTMKNDFGLLFLMKFPFATPDIVWDGIPAPGTNFQMCLSENGEFNFGNLDALNEFEGLTTEWSEFECTEGTISQL